jgi:small subunit ribosomal protein S16
MWPPPPSQHSWRAAVPNDRSTEYRRREKNTVVKLRLMRMGKKKQPTYRVVAADARSPRNGRFIEIVGHYDPRRDPSVISIDNDKAVAWLLKGAQPTETVEKLLKISGAWDQFKTGVRAEPAPAPAPAPAAEPVTASVGAASGGDDAAPAAEESAS